MQENKTHAGIACVLSFIFNGLGQLYNGQIIKGLIIMSISILGIIVFILGSILVGLWLLEKITSTFFLFLGGLFLGLGLICICIVGIYSIFDAYKFRIRQ